jgi:hypothetical protein
VHIFGLISSLNFIDIEYINTYLDIALQFGVSIVNIPSGDLQARLGHASSATIGIYLNANPKHRPETY